LSRYKFPHEHGYDKAAVVVAAIVEDICTLVRNYFDHAGQLCCRRPPSPRQTRCRPGERSERAELVRLRREGR
jgi:hypothetical protein